MDVLVRNIEPEADTLCILQGQSLAVRTKTEPGVLDGVAVLGVQRIGFQAHGIVAVMNLSVLPVSQRKRKIRLPVCSVLSVVDDIPHVYIRLSALKVIEHHGTFAQLELNRCSRIRAHVQGCRHITGQVGGCAFFVHCREAQTVKCAKRGVGGGEGDVVRAETDLVDAVIDRRLDRNYSSLSERNRHYRLREGNLSGSGNGDRTFTDNRAVVGKLRRHSAFCSVGNKDAVVDRAHAVFLDRPDSILGNVNLGADCVSAKGGELHGAAGSIVVIIRVDGRTGKDAVSGGSGDDKDGVGSGSFAAVGKRAVDLQLLAGTLRHERGGTAAVTVCSVNAAHLDHVVSHLIHTEAFGIRSLLTVGDGHHDRAIRFDTDEGSCSLAGGMHSGGLGELIHGDAVCIGLDQPLPDTNRVLLPTGQGVGLRTHQNLRHISRSGFAGYRMIVIVDNQNGVALYKRRFALAVLIVVAIQDVVVQRLANVVRMGFVIHSGVPAQHGIGRSNNVAIAVFLRPECLGRGRFSAIVAVGRNHALIAGNDLRVRIVHVNRDSVENLALGSFRVVHDDFCFINAGSQIPVALGNELVIVICRCTGIENDSSQ